MRKNTSIIIWLTICLIISGCGPGQLFGPTLTITPSPTTTPTPTRTPRPTATSTPTALPPMSFKDALSLDSGTLFTLIGRICLPDQLIIGHKDYILILLPPEKTCDDIKGVRDIPDNYPRIAISIGTSPNHVKNIGSFFYQYSNLQIITNDGTIVGHGDIIKVVGVTDYHGRVIPEVINAFSSNPFPSGPALGSKEETEAAINQQIKNLTSIANARPSPNNSTTKYEIKLNNSGEHLIWSDGWCATTENILAKNLERIIFELYVNDQPINLDTAFSISFKQSGKYCFSYAVVIYAWPSGTTVITSKLITKNTINDGIQDYPTFEFTRVYEVNAP